MEDEFKSRDELISELTRLRERITLWEQSDASASQREQGSGPDAGPAPSPSEQEVAWTNHVKLSRTTRLLQAMNAAQERFITHGDPKDLFDGLLSALLSITESQYGFIDEVHTSEDGTVYRHVRAITNIAWDEETRTAYEKLDREGFKFFNLNTLTGAVVTGGKPVISNDPARDPRRRGLPPGHPAIHSFLGLPLVSGGTLVGIVGAANRQGGYSQHLADFLKPYLDTCANIISAYRNEQRRRDAEAALRDERETLEKRVQERTADLRKTNELLEEEVAERKRISQALTESELRYRTVFENAGDAILLIQADGERAGTIVSANQTAAEIHGYTVNELLGMNISDLDPAVNPQETSPYRDQLDCGEVIKHEVEHRRKDGSVFPVEMCVALVELGNEKYLLATDRDITDRKLAEKALRESERKYREFAEFLPQIVYELDEQGDFTFVNKAGLDAGGYAQEELATGLNVMQLCAPQDRAKVAEDFAKLMNGESILGTEYTALRKNGETFPFIAYMSPIERHNRIEGIRGVALDITELKRAVDISQQLRFAAEQASRAKSEFLANMSHELRTPLNAVIGFSEILEDRLFGSLNETQLKYVGYIVSSGRHLLRLIDDLLDLARIESGRMRLQLSQVSVPEILKNSLVMMKETLKAHRLRLELCITPELRNASIRADEVRLRQVVFNLLSNAAKFTPDEGSIQVKARKSDDEVVVTVSDTGIGIDPSDQHRIFKIFEQVESPSPGLRSGTGLGLALTRNLVEMHGGRIWVESKGHGHGSSFTFSIPARGPHASEITDSASMSSFDPLEDADCNGTTEILEDSWIQFRVLCEEGDVSGS